MDGPELQKELAIDVLKSACKYTKYRMDWFFYCNEEKLNNDPYRTSCHNKFIDSLNIFLRYLAQNDDSIINLQEEILNMNRKDVGDIGNFLAYKVALSQR